VSHARYLGLAPIGCMIQGACQWRGDVIAEHPEGGDLCGPDQMDLVLSTAE
jgi:hypothetical protein